MRPRYRTTGAPPRGQEEPQGSTSSCERTNTLIDAISNGGVVLTATSRLARELHAQFDLAMRERGERLWSTPRILPLSNWVEECWASAAQTSVVLSIEQDRFLWQQVILASPESRELLQIAGAAGAAQEAWRLMCEW